MSHHEYEVSRKIAAEDPPFYGIVMAALRKADDKNYRLLRAAFPTVEREFQDRYNLPAGMYPSEVDALPDDHPVRVALKSRES